MTILCALPATPLQSQVLQVKEDVLRDRIAFVAQVDDNWDLFVSSLDGEGFKRLTETPYDEVDPSWAPDKSKIAFSATDGVLRVLDLETGEVKEFSPSEPRARYIQPSFSPDGRLIAFALHSTAEGDAADLAVLDLDTGKIDALLEEPSLQLYPAWSADQSSIFYVCLACTTEDGKASQEIWRLSLESGSSERLTSTGAHCDSPAPSPDGKATVFSSDKGGQYDLWLSWLENGELDRLTDTPARETDPCWSKDGRSIAFTASREGRLGIYIIEIETGNISRFAPFRERDIQCKNPAL